MCQLVLFRTSSSSFVILRSEALLGAVRLFRIFRFFRVLCFLLLFPFDQAYETGYSRAGLLGGFDLALEAAIALKVETPGINSWSDMSKLFGEVPSTAPLSERPILIEQKLNRRFTHAHLLTEALVSTLRIFPSPIRGD